MRKFQPVFPRSLLLKVYKTIIRSHFDYADVVSHQIYKLSFLENRESIQYNAALAVIGAISGCFLKNFTRS